MLTNYVYYLINYMLNYSTLSVEILFGVKWFKLFLPITFDNEMILT